MEKFFERALGKTFHSGYYVWIMSGPTFHSLFIKLKTKKIVIYTKWEIMSRSMHLFVRSAIIKCIRLGSLNNSDFLKVLEAKSLRPRYEQL